MGVQLGSKRMNQGSPRDGRYATNRDCRIYYETFGDSARPTLLLVNGLGSQCINYSPEWCGLFVDAGFHVIRFDNRDVGLSTHFTDAPTDDRGAAYRLPDMAGDAVGVLEAAGVDSPAELAQRNAANLAQTFSEVDAARPNMVRRVPSEDVISGWIAEAKTLPKVVEH